MNKNKDLNEVSGVAAESGNGPGSGSPVLGRRDLLKGLLGGVALSQFPILGNAMAATGKGKIRAMAFDAFPIFDPRPVFGLVKQTYPEHGPRFSVQWRTRIFEYTWLRTSAGQYQDFWQCIGDALEFTARDLGVELGSQRKKQLMATFMNLKPWPDVVAALEVLRKQGIKLGFLSNMTEKMLSTNVNNNGMGALFDEIISTDEAKTFKPDPRAYQLGMDRFGLGKDEILFVAFASWDASGAKWFGYPTAWVNRLNFTPENLDAEPDSTGSNLSILSGFV